MPLSHHCLSLSRYPLFCFKLRLLKMTHDMVAVVAAAATKQQGGRLGIGHGGQLPWTIKADLQHFRRVTCTSPSDGNTKNAVIMGRKTWESIPPKFRPLPGRINVVLTRTSDYQIGDETAAHNSDGADADATDAVIVANSLQDASAKLQRMKNVGTVFVIGGEQIYKAAFDSGLVKKVVYTEISNVPANQEFDAYFPCTLSPEEWIKQPYRYPTTPSKKDSNKDDAPNNNNKGKENGPTNLTSSNKDQDASKLKQQQHEDESVVMIDSTSGLSYSFWEFTHRNTEELAYLKLCREIIDTGIRRGDRTGTGTLSKFGSQLRFNLRNGKLPLLTTKRTFWRGLAEELLWFIAGNTNANDLASKGVHIWDGNGSREFLDERGLSHREVGDLGPVYGFQWRHFGAKYKDMHHDYTDQGVDQLADCIDKIKNNPEDRRIVLSAWNPADLDLMALPPCHMFCQFYVDTDKQELSCQMYQRSADMGLGVPFNIASYALLTHLVAHVTGLTAGDFVHTLGDAHVYLNHVEALQEQLEREPRDFPTLKINPAKTDIDDFVFEDFEVIGYNPHKTIKMKMAV